MWNQCAKSYNTTGISLEELFYRLKTGVKLLFTWIPYNEWNIA